MASDRTLNTLGFTEGEQELVRMIGTNEAPIAVQLRNHLVASREYKEDGTAQLEINVPKMLRFQSDEVIHQWAHDFFTKAFGSNHVSVEWQTQPDTDRIGVVLDPAASQHYRLMMRDLDLAQATQDAQVQSAAR